jgi:hypothetical protein
MGEPPRDTAVAMGPQQEGAAAASAASTGEAPRDTAVAMGPQQEEAAAAAATAVAAAVVSASPALVLTAGDHAAVVDVADDDALPPGGANGKPDPRQPPSLCW